MASTWQTEEVIRQLDEENREDVQELIKEAGDEAGEALQEWIREGSGPKSLYDAVMRFTRVPNHSFDTIDWDEVVHYFENRG